MPKRMGRQFVDALGVGKAARQRGVRVGFGRFAAQRQQAGDLGFFPSPLMHASGSVRRPREQTSAVDADRRDLRRLLNLNRELAFGVQGRLLVPRLGKLPTEVLSELDEMRDARRNRREFFQHRLGRLSRFDMGVEDDHFV